MSAPRPRTADLDLVFGALADSTRRGILAHVAQHGAASVNDLVALFDISQPAISKHLKVLEHAGLVHRDRDGQLRPVRLNAAPMQAAASWLGQYEHHWVQRLDALAVYVAKLQRERAPTTTTATTATTATTKKTTTKKTPTTKTKRKDAHDRH